MSLADRILEAGSAGDYDALKAYTATVNAAGRALADAYELARVVTRDQDRDRAMTAPMHRDPRVPHVDGDQGDWIEGDR